MFNIAIPTNITLRPPLLACALLACAVAAPGALAQSAPATQVVITDAQIKRAGIATAPALASLPEAAASGGSGIVLSGTVVAPTTAMTVSASAWAGMLQEVHVAPLQVVKAGTPLVTLFSQPWMELQRDYVEAAAQARLSAARLQREESLFADGIIARVRLDETRAAAQMSRLAAEQRAQALRAGGMGAAAIQQLAQQSATLSPLLTVRAPAAGTVVELPLAVGQQIEAGMAVAKVVRDVPLWVELQASRQQLPAIQPGDQLQVAEHCHLKVVAISPMVNSANQTALVRAEQVERNACLKVNAFVEARLAPRRTQPGYLAVPAAALVRHGAATYVFVRNAKGFLAVPVQAGPSAGEQVWVKGALTDGAPVAMRGLVAIKGAWSGLGEPAAADGKGQP